MRKTLTALTTCIATFLVATALLAASMVDLNTASQKDLVAVKGIGASTATKIIAARPYTSVDQLSKAGLSAKQIDSLRPFVTVSGASAPSVATTAAKPVTAAPATGSKTVATTPAVAPKPSTTLPKGAPASGKVDLNTASESALVAVNGIGPSTAKKIIAARPYSSVDQLSKAGLSAKQVDSLRASVIVSSPPPSVPVSVAKPVTPAPAQVAKPATTSSAHSPATGPVDVNTASEKELVAVNGIGTSTAKKIIAARPYSSVDQLSKAGLSTKQIDSFRTQVKVSGASTAAPAPPKSAVNPLPAPPASSTPASTPRPASPAPASSPKLAPGQTVNINTASLEQLEALPEIGPVKGQAIIDGRPYKTIEDVMKVKGIKEGTFSKIKDLITVN